MVTHELRHCVRMLEQQVQGDDCSGRVPDHGGRSVWAEVSDQSGGVVGVGGEAVGVVLGAGDGAGGEAAAVVGGDCVG
jgi:hypothetical protein